MGKVPQALEHVLELTLASRYRAPAAPVKPFRIPPGLELVEILTGGRVDFPVADRFETFTKGTVFCHLAGEETIHRNHLKDPYRCVAVHFKVSGPPYRRLPRVFRWKDTDSALAFSAMLLELKTRSAHSPEFCGLHAYSRLLLEAEQAMRDEPLGQPWPIPLQKAIQFIEGQFTRPIHLPEVAAHSGISVPYLHGLFSHHFMKPPHRLVLDLRLKKSRALLVGSDYKLREIARRVGFASPEYFCRIFTREHGIAPIAYRKRYAQLAPNRLLKN